MRLEVRGAYPLDWRAIAYRVKSEAGWRCIRCGHPHDPQGVRGCGPVCRGHQPDERRRCLTVHHLDGDKGNCRWWNLLALCQACHLSIQARVIPDRAWLWDHSEWFQPYVAGFYAFAYARLEPSREDVVADVDRFLQMGQPWRACG